MAAHEAPRPKIKKRKYSRKGCQECKRRKIKCDEAYPACFNCSRLNKPCSYSGGGAFDDEDAYHIHGRSSHDNYQYGHVGRPSDHGFSNQQNYQNHTNPARTVRGDPLVMKFYEPSRPVAAHNGNSGTLSHARGSVSHKSSFSGPSPGDVGETQIPGISGVPIIPGLAGIGQPSPHMSFGNSPGYGPTPGTLGSLSHYPGSNGHHQNNGNGNSNVSGSGSGNGNGTLGTLGSLAPTNNNANANGHSNSRASNMGSISEGSTHNSVANGLDTFADASPNFIQLEMDDFSNNVNLFLDDFCFHRAFDAPSTPLDFSTMDPGAGTGSGTGTSAGAGPQSLGSPSVTGFGEMKAGGTTTNGIGITEGMAGGNGSSEGSTSGAKETSPEPEPEFNISDFAFADDARPPPLDRATIDDCLQRTSSYLTERSISENGLSEPHVYYLRLLSATDLSFHLFPFAPSVEHNGVVKLLLIYSVRCPYLLTSLLSISATFQFLRTGETRHDRASNFYIDVCFRALNEAFVKQRCSENSAVFASSIEKLLLTVLIASTRFTATTAVSDVHAPSSWMLQLKGARDLLIRYSEMTKSSSARRAPYMSSGLALAKCWFFAIEASAAMHTAVGGALSRAAAWDGSHKLPDLYLHAPSVDLDEEYPTFVDTGCIEHRVHPEYLHALSRVSLVYGGGSSGTKNASSHARKSDASASKGRSPAVFNLYWGFNSSFLRPVLAFVSITDAVKRRSLPHVPFKWTMHLLGLLDASLQERVVPDVCLHTFEIPRSSPGHPEYDGPDRLQLPESCYVAETMRAGGSSENGPAKVYYSWFDASHQFHNDYLSLRVLVSPNFLGLPRSHPDVQYLVKKFFDGAFFIKPKASPEYELERHHVLTDSKNYYLGAHSFDIRCIMVQSLFRLASGIVVEEDQFERIELYFMGVLKLGNGSSLNALDMVTRVRSLRNENKERLNGEIDEKIYDFYDIMNDIPFS